MDYFKFLNEVIKRGIDAARRDYTRDEQQEMLNGSVAGFVCCRGKTPDQLRELLERVRKEMLSLGFPPTDKYWFYRCKEAEVEWVCNCVGAMLMDQGLPVIYAPTARAMLSVADIIGVKGGDDEKVE